MSVAIFEEATEGPLSRHHHEELAQANLRAKKVRRAASVAAFNGWAAGIFAVLSAPFAMFSIAGFLITTGLALIAANEFRGRRGLLRFDPDASSVLGWNQIALGGLIVLYSAWMLYTNLSAGGPFAGELEAHPELTSALDSLEGFDDLFAMIVLAVYGSVIVLSVVFQGGNAYYYFSRREYVEAYLKETPDWVVELQRSGE